MAEKDDTELDARIERASYGALRRYSRNPDAVLDELLRLERERIAALLEELVSIDRQREPFSIDSVEADLETRLAGIDLRLRVDRMDRYGDGSLAILDYKTGARRRFIDASGEYGDTVEQNTVLGLLRRGPALEQRQHGECESDAEKTGKRW